MLPVQVHTTALLQHRVESGERGTLTAVTSDP